MKTFITNVKSDPEVYSIFLREAKARGLYKVNLQKTQNVELTRKEYSS